MALIQFRQVDGLENAINIVSGSALTSKNNINYILSGSTLFQGHKYFNGDVDITGSLLLEPTGVSTTALTLKGNSTTTGSYGMQLRESTNSIYSPNTGRLRIQSIQGGSASGILELESTQPLVLDCPGIDTSSNDIKNIINASSTGAYQLRSSDGPLLNLSTAGGSYVGIGNNAPQRTLDISGDVKARGTLTVNSQKSVGYIDNVIIASVSGATSNQSKLRMLSAQNGIDTVSTNSGLYLSTVGEGAAMTGYIGTSTDGSNGLDLEYIMGFSKVMALRSNYDIELGQTGAFGAETKVKVYGDVLPSGTRSLGSASKPWNKIYSNSAIGWHGNEEKITILPSDFVVDGFNDPSLSQGNVMIYSTTGDPAGLQVLDEANNSLTCFKTIPKGYKATSFGISGASAGSPTINYYTGSLYDLGVGGMPIGGISAGLNEDTNIGALYQLQGGSWDATLALQVSIASSGDLIYGGYIGIERV